MLFNNSNVEAGNVTVSMSSLLLISSLPEGLDAKGKENVWLRLYKLKGSDL